MASQVNVNALTVVHAGSEGIAPAFPDVCLTPSPAGPPVPVPYPNLAKSADTAQGTKSVIVEGNPVMVQDAVFATSTGDEAGSAGGVASATTKGKARFVNYSFDVKLEGRCVARLGDPMTHNELATANTAPFPEIQPPCPMAPSIGDGGDAVEADGAAAPPVQNEPSHVFVWDWVSERQWVNLPAEWGPDCGRRVTLVGHIEPRDSGRQITFRLLPDAANPQQSARRRAELGDGAIGRRRRRQDRRRAAELRRRAFSGFGTDGDGTICPQPPHHRLAPDLLSADHDGAGARRTPL